MDKLEIVQQLQRHFDRESVHGLPEQWFPQASVEEASNDLPGSGKDRLQLLQSLKEQALSCQKCRLSEARKNVVFGAGNTDRPAIAFIGEGPGAEEDAQGEPFVGKAGQLLTAAITKGMGLTRGDVYISNVVKCRPPENRAPLPDEVQSCSPYLFEQLKLIQPRVIVALGGPAQKALCGVDQGITKLRGRWLEWEGVKVMPTFHPAYILRNPAVKKDFWIDLQEVMKEIGLSK